MAHSSPAPDAPVTHFLALAPLSSMDEYKPLIIAPFSGKDKCFRAAEHMNATDEDLKKPEAIENHWHYVCLQIQYPGVI